MLADLVTPGNRLVDVGCDHGYLSIYLVRKGICPRALAMDVRKGPLAGAEEHIAEYGLGNYIETRLSDGLGAYAAGEADTLVCAGMGGRLMEKIITDGRNRMGQLRELILQPQSQLREFRVFLRKAGFCVTAEDAVCEDGKYYFAMKVVLAQTTNRTAAREEESLPGQLSDSYGELLLAGRHPVLRDFLVQRQECLLRLLGQLEDQCSEKAGRRLGELQRELAQVQRALSFYTEGQA